MKRKWIIAAALALALTACNSDGEEKSSSVAGLSGELEAPKAESASKESAASAEPAPGWESSGESAPGASDKQAPGELSSGTASKNLDAPPVPESAAAPAKKPESAAPSEQPPKETSSAESGEDASKPPAPASSEQASAEKSSNKQFMTKTYPVDEETPPAPADDKWYEEGVYEVGADLPPGEYFLVPYDGHHGYFQINKSPEFVIAAIQTERALAGTCFVTVQKGEYLQVDGASFTNSKNTGKLNTPKNGYYTSGVYRVGLDIPAGHYFYKCEGDSAMGLYRDSRWRDDSLIAGADITGTGYVDVDEGEYLYLHDVIIDLSLQQ